MNLEDLIKLAGVTKSPYDTPVQEQLPSESECMRTLIALVTPEQLNQLKGEEAVAEELPGEATTEPNPQPYEGPLGSPADLSLRRYLGANGVPVNVDETKVYEDHKVEDITESWKEYKAEHHQKDAEGNTIPHDDEVAEGMYGKKKKKDESVEEAVVDEDDVEEDNAFNSAAANAKKAGKKSFSFNGKTYPVKIDDKTADALTDDIESVEINNLRTLAGI